MIDLNNKHIIITGGELSLLHGLIKPLQSGGAQITLVHHNPAVTQTIADSYRCQTLILDWGNLDTASNQLETLEKIHGAVICPEWHSTGAFIDTTPADWDTAMVMNYESAVYISQAIVKQMITNQIQGSIVFLTSVATLMPMLNTSVVGASLAALTPLAKMAAVDCGQYHIRINMIAMGWIETESTRPFMSGNSGNHLEHDIPLQTIGRPKDIGNVCCFLMSDLAQYVTGAVLTVDGGYTLTRS